MTLARYNLTATDRQGNVIAGASVEIRTEIPGQPLVPIYSDRDGATPVGNPLTTDTNGDAGFYVAGGVYKITVKSGIYSQARRHVSIGMAQGSDLATNASSERVVTAAGSVTVTNDDADVILINKNVGAATSVVLPDPSTTIKKVRIVDRKYDAATNNITITSAGTSKKVMGGTSYVIDSNGGSIELKPLSDGTGWI